MQHFLTTAPISQSAPLNGMCLDTLFTTSSMVH
jgi:hypothetical protein